ncbi:hypothetical protein Hanom_Chr14g01310981 [Helianthus anomalus]
MAFGCGHKVLLCFHILLQTNFKFIAFGSQEQIATMVSMTLLVIQGRLLTLMLQLFDSEIRYELSNSKESCRLRSR